VAFEQAAILGLGLIGTSLGQALRASQGAHRVVGFDVDAESLRRAARQGAIDRSCGTLPEVCRGSDLVVLAAPVSAILRLLPELAPHLENGCLVTDTGGTKGEIVRLADRVLPRHAAFVGGHPLAGRLTAGTTDATPNLYTGTIYCLTPSPSAEPSAVDRAVQLVEQIRAQPHFLDPDEHDALLSAISHLPYFTSVALVNTITTQSSWGEMATLAAGGFRSAAAPVQSDPRVWVDVAATNRANLLRQLDGIIGHLEQIRALVSQGDEMLLPQLSHARDAHARWLADRGEAPPPAPPIPSQGAQRRGWTSWLRRG
jgi:prephenate dehydrogenase